MKRLNDWYGDNRHKLYSITSLLFMFPKLKKTLFNLLVALDAVLLSGEPVYMTYVKE